MLDFFLEFFYRFDVGFLGFFFRRVLLFFACHHGLWSSNYTAKLEANCNRAK